MTKTSKVIKEIEKVTKPKAVKQPKPKKFVKWYGTNRGGPIFRVLAEDGDVSLRIVSGDTVLGIYGYAWDKVGLNSTQRIAKDLLEAVTKYHQLVMNLKVEE